MGIQDNQSIAEKWNMPAGNVALSFANTMDWHASEQPIELLTSYKEFTAWARDYAVISQAQKDELDAQAENDLDKSRKQLTDVQKIRDVLFRIFEAEAHERDVDLKDLDYLMHKYTQAMDHAKISNDGIRYAITWPKDATDLEHPIWEIVRGSIELLLSENRIHVGQCADDRGCGFLFLDTSKNHSRRWCSMENCGNRAKAQRHYQKNAIN